MTTSDARRSTPGHDLDRVLLTDDLVTSDNVFFVATGITDGELLARRPLPRRRRGDPLPRDARRAAARSALIESEHRLDKLRAYAAVDFDHTHADPGGPSSVITVCGETVADLVAQPDGDYRAYPGGSPANVALALARLGEADDLRGPPRAGRVRAPHARPPHSPTGSTRAISSRPRSPRPSPSSPSTTSGGRRMTSGPTARPTGSGPTTTSPTHPALEAVAFHTGSLASWTPPGDAALRHGCSLGPGRQGRARCPTTRTSARAC